MARNCEDRLLSSVVEQGFHPRGTWECCSVAIAIFLLVRSGTVRKVILNGGLDYVERAS